MTVFAARAVSNWYSFVAMQYCALVLNRTYKAFVTDDYVCGIQVGGPASARSHRPTSDSSIPRPHRSNVYKVRDLLVP